MRDDNHFKRVIIPRVVGGDNNRGDNLTLKIEGNVDRTAKVYKFICPIFRLDKTGLHQGLEKLSEDRMNGYGI